MMQIGIIKISALYFMGLGCYPEPAVGLFFILKINGASGERG